MVIYKFLDNPEWYYFDEKEEIYKLTDKATDEAKESYKDYMENIKK